MYDSNSLLCKFCRPIEIRESSNITFANLHMYRVVSSFQPFPYAIRVTNSKDIRLRNIHCYSDSKVGFDNAVYDPNRPSSPVTEQKTIPYSSLKPNNAPIQQTPAQTPTQTPASTPQPTSQPSNKE